jgi:hypothetical protein
MNPRLLLLLVCVVVSACSASRHRAADTAAATRVTSSAPTLDAIRPDSVFIASGAVVEVVLRGSGFVPGRPGHNTVLLGTAAFNEVPASDDGKEIRFVIPDRLPSGGEAAPMPIDPGSYPVRVRTPNGESNPVNVRVYR